MIMIDFQVLLQLRSRQTLTLATMAGEGRDKPKLR